MRRHTFLWLAAGLVLASLGAAGAQESPLSERVRNTLEEIIERREKAPPVKRVKNPLEEYRSDASKRKAREGPEDEISRIRAAKGRAEALRARVVAKAHFYCGETFITVPIDESVVVTLRKAHISGLLWDQKKRRVRVGR